MALTTVCDCSSEGCSAGTHACMWCIQTHEDIHTETYITVKSYKQTVSDIFPGNVICNKIIKNFIST